MDVNEYLSDMEILLNEKSSRTLEWAEDGKVIIDGKERSYDLLKVTDKLYHLLLDGVSYRVTVQALDTVNKTAELELNGMRFSVKGKDEFDALLDALGMTRGASNKVKDLKAPMPGLVLEVCVTDGQTVSEGDALVILEAMKMENVLKSPQDGVVRLSDIKVGKAVEKGDVLVKFAD